MSHRNTPSYVTAIIWAVKQGIEIPNEIFVKPSEQTNSAGRENFTPEFLKIYDMWIEHTYSHLRLK